MAAAARSRGLGSLALILPGAYAPGFMLSPAPQAGCVYFSELYSQDTNYKVVCGRSVTSISIGELKDQQSVADCERRTDAGASKGKSARSRWLRPAWPLDPESNSTRQQRDSV
jgi:hypothetical protein